MYLKRLDYVQIRSYTNAFLSLPSKEKHKSSDLTATDEIKLVGLARPISFQSFFHIVRGVGKLLLTHYLKTKRFVLGYANHQCAIVFWSLYDQYC